MIALRVAIAGLALSLAAAAAPCLNGGPAVTTDKSDYGPSETVAIAGCGASFRERLTVRITAPDGTRRNASGPEAADDRGAFELSYSLPATLTDGSYTVDVVNSRGAIVASTQFRRSPEAYATCAITDRGGVKCWGFGGHGQLGNGSYSNSAVPVDVAGLTDGVAQISVGLYHVCAVTTSGAAKCWGSNLQGQLGVDGIANSPAPVDVASLTSGVAQISAGNSQTCAVTTAGGVKCWGGARRGAPADVAGLASGVAQVSAGGDHACVVTTAGAAKCWGEGRYGALGDGSSAKSDAPVDVLGLASGVVQISAGYRHTCAVTADGAAKCWGDNQSGQLGTGFGSSNRPVGVRGLSGGVAQISTNFFSTCAVMTAGGLKCWGSHTPTPVDVTALNGRALQVAAGNPHTCALTEGGAVECWGSGPFGALGNGTFGRSDTPVNVHGLERGAARLPDVVTRSVTAPAAASTPAAGYAGSSTDPDFLWLAPTVATSPATTGPFDATLLDALAVEICELTASGACSTPLVQRFTSITPIPLVLDSSREFYTADWLAQVSPAPFYRVRVLRAGRELGTIDVDVVDRTADLAGVDAARYIGVVRGESLTIRFRVQRPTPTTRVKINEIESDGGNPGDWVELINTAATPLNLAGYILKDNDDTHAYTFPAGTVIPAEGYYVVEEAALGFGLGGGDSVRLYDAAGTLFDSYVWTAHAATTYARCPNGAGAFATSTTATKGFANHCGRIRINEVESDGGTPGDWVELFNAGAAPVDISGFVFRDNDDTHGYTIPAGTVVAPGAYYVLEEAAIGFGLGGVDGARLFRTDGTVADSYYWTAHASTTYGRCPNGAGEITTTLGATKGAANNCVAPITTIHINEVESNGGTPGDWIELINSGSSAIDVSGWSVVDNDDTHVKYKLPAGTIIPAGGYFVVEESAMGFGLGGEDSARLYDAAGALYETYSWTVHASTTYGRCPNGTGAFTTTAAPTKGAANSCGGAAVLVKVNEVESNGGTPGDWVELFNAGTAAADLSGYIFRDNDDTHNYAIPAGTVVQPGAYYVLEEAAFGFGLGGADSARLFSPTGTLIDSYAWTEHAAITYGRCPNGTGAFVNTAESTKGAVNRCGAAPVTTVHINEVESNGGTPGDWVELINTGSTPADVSGWSVVDNDDTHTRYKLPTGTIIPAGGYFVVEEADLGFGLGAADSVRLFDAAGAVFESYDWTAHATTTYGRCPNGTGAFATTAESTKGAANRCVSAAASVHINEVESNGGTPGDWVELINTGSTPVDISGWGVLDNDDTHTRNKFPAGTVIQPGGYYIVEEVDLGFGLGTPDSVRLFDASGTLVETYSWTPHAATTYGRCPNGTGEFATTTVSTKGAANNCGNLIKVNEVESNGGTPGDWVELYNAGSAAADISGYIFRDNDDTHAYVIPAGTVVSPGAYYVLEEAAFGFGLGGADNARLFDPAGALVDSYTWTEHATTTYGRCPNGSGAFTTTSSPTKGAVNACPGVITTLAWPGGADVQTVDGLNVFGGNMSGLVYEASGTAAPGVLWAVRNGPGSLFRLVWNGSIWSSDNANSWGSGKTLLYPGGTGSPDSEGVTFAGTGSSAGIYVSTERDNNVNAISRNSILRFDPAGAGATLTATHEWNLTADLPSTGANLGIEGITWIPDSFLVARGFFDESKGRAYNPADYANHGTGLFFLSLEANGQVYAYALDHTAGGFTRVATITSGFPGVMDLHFDREQSDLWAVCDDTCEGRTAILRIDAATGKFTVARLFDRPAQMPNLNNEGFAIAPLAECVNNARPVFWTDDTETGGHAIRRGTMTCGPL